VSGGSSTGFGINSAGQIVGGASDSAGDEHAFWWNGQSMIDLGTLGGATSVAFAISDTGEIVGDSGLDDNGDSGVFLYENGTMYNLMNLLAPGSGITSLELAEGDVLSSNGQIVAEAEINNGGTYQMVILTPTPEPTGPLLLLIGVGAATLLHRRRPAKSTSPFASTGE
jgi:probable HAF family extracellular repeat protein